MTHTTPTTPDTIAQLRKELSTHQQEATYRTGKGMFHTARAEIDNCINLVEKIQIELVRGV